MVGYKQTDVGLIPDVWEIDIISNLSTITTGAKNTQDRIDNGEFPFFVRSQTVEKINSYSFDGEAVLTAGDGVGTGKIFHYINGKFDFHQRVYRVSHFTKKLDGFYFYLYFSNHFYNRIMQMTAKSSVDSVRMEMIADMPIPLPPLPEQEAIAEVLSDTDALITTLEKRIAKKRNIKQGAMQTLLTPQEDWEVKKLIYCLVEKPKYGIGAAAIDNNSNFPTYLRITDIQDDGNISQKELKSVNHPESHNYYLSDGDIVFARTGASVGKSYLHKEENGKFVYAGFLIKVNPNKNKLIPYFLKSYVSTQSYWDWVNVMSMRSGQPGINGNEFGELPIPLPPLAEQEAIVEVMSDTDMLITALEKKLSKTKELKQGLMQELLTGKIRLV